MSKHRKHVMLVFTSVLTASALFSCSDPERTDSAANHSTQGQESENLYTLPGLEHGLMQSPVNILTSKTESGDHRIVLRPDGATALENVKIGHSVELGFTPGATLLVDGETYDFVQCHFHTPSEHQIDGVTYPMELHCVNRLQAGDGSPQPPRYLVTAFLFKMGMENEFVAGFLDRVPESSGPRPGAKPDSAVHRRFSVSDLAEEIRISDRYYFYNGSLTTPPYTETVTWHVLSRIFEAAPEQIQAINRLEGNNARRVHMLRDRVVGAAE